MKFTCLCCGYKTLDEPTGGTYQICELCDWEDDGVQSDNPDYQGGANGISLREAQHKFTQDSVNCQNYEKDKVWKILAPPSSTTGLNSSKTDFTVNSKGVVNKKDA